MTQKRPTASDPELIALVRAGDAAAYEELFVRHREVALRLARRLADPERAEDLCSEAFAKILSLLQRGKGPDVSFRAYLLTTVRTLYLNSLRTGSHESTVADSDLQVLTVPVEDDPEARFDEGAIARAFKQLPERWQSALWLTAVEGMANKEVSRHLGIHANAVASLAFRARAGLRQAYLAEHLRETAGTECARIVDLLPAYLRGTLTPRRRAVVQAHLDRCSRCSVAAAELADVDRRLGALVGPALLGAGAAAALWPATAGVPAVPAAAGALAGYGNGGFAGIFGSSSGTLSLAKVASAMVLAAASAGITAHQVAQRFPEPPPSSSRPHQVDLVSPKAPAPPAPSPTPTVAPPRPTTAVATDPMSAPRTSPAGITAAAGPTPPSRPSTSLPVAPATGPSTVPAPAPAPVPVPVPSPSTTAPVTPPAASTMGIGPMRAETVRRNLMSWNRVTVPVSHPAKDAKLRLTSTRTVLAALVIDDSTGWICGTPVLSWAQPQVLGSTVTDCVHNGRGQGAPLQIEYGVLPGAQVVAVLTPPAGFVDDSTADNVASLDLIG